MKLLPYILATLTQHDRQIVEEGIDFNWSANSITYNLFRFYEVIFGRKIGIRFEGMSTIRKGKEYHVFGTWENLFVYAEYLIREAFSFNFGFKLIPITQLAGIPQAMQSPFMFAIALDAGSISSTTASSVSLTVTGSNNYLFASGGYSNGAGAISATYNSVAMTSSATQLWIGVSNPMNGMYLVGPATGTHTLAITSGSVACMGINYSGCKQVVPDAYTTTANTGASITITINTSTANCWMIMYATSANGNLAAGTGATTRIADVGVAGGLLDSNGTITTGGYSMTAQGFGISPGNGAVAYTFAPSAAAVNSGFFMLS